LSDIGTIQWYSNQNAPLPFYSGNVYQTPVLSNDTSFYVQAVNNGCALNPKKLVRALVGSNFAPTAPIMSNDTTVCLASGNAIALMATVGSSLAVRWFDVASGGSSIQAGKIYYFLPTKREIKTLYADAFNGVCGSTRVPINVTVEDYPSISKILTDTICKGDSARVGFALNFGEANWYDAQTSGNLLHTGSQYTSAPTSSTDYYIETVSSVCVNPNRTKISTLVNTYPAIIKVWGDTICAKNPATLKSKFTGKGSMLWFDADTSTIALGSGNTFKTPTLNGGRKYFVRPAYAGCIGPMSSVQPLVKPVPFSGFSFEVLTWQQVRVSPINSSGASIKWYFGDGTTSNNSNVTHRYANTGKYTIRLVMTSLSNGCKDSTLVEVQVDPSGIETQYNQAGLKLFPNPTQNNLHIESDMDLDGLNFKVYSLTGMLLMQNIFNTELLESGLNLSELPVGLYLLSIQNHKPQVFVKQ
jgi:PKD repeat protein